MGNASRIFLQPDWQIDNGIFNRPIKSNPGTQVMAQNKDFCAVLQTDLVPSVAQVVSIERGQISVVLEILSLIYP